MSRSRVIGLAVGSSFFVLAILLALGSSAQMSGFVAKPLLQSTLEGDESKEATMLAITIAPGGSSGRHTHPGDCYGTVFEGTAELRVDGRGVVNTLVVDKGTPRMQPAPPQ